MKERNFWTLIIKPRGFNGKVIAQQALELVFGEKFKQTYPSPDGRIIAEIDGNLPSNQESQPLLEDIQSLISSLREDSVV